LPRPDKSGLAMTEALGAAPPTPLEKRYCPICEQKSRGNIGDANDFQA